MKRASEEHFLVIHSASCGDHLTTVLEYPLLPHQLILGPLGTGSHRKECPEKGMVELRTSENSILGNIHTCNETSEREKCV